MKLALATPETTAIRVMAEFGRQGIANILHIIAKKPYKTCLLPELERRAEAISGEFKDGLQSRCGHMRRSRQSRGSS